MSGRTAFLTIGERIDRERERFVRLGNRAPGEANRLVLEEIWCSSLLAGAGLELSEVTALVGRGVAIGGHPLDDYVLAADYATAVRYGATLPALGRRRIFVRTEEIVRFHALATRREPGAEPGAWRSVTAPAFATGAVPPPPWLIARDMTAFVDRVAQGPAAGTHSVAWAADAHQRFTRIHPFRRGNGRVARLVTNLLLQRAGWPPFAVRGRTAERYRTALGRADSRDPWPLAIIFAQAVAASLTRLTVAAESDGDLQPLARFATGAERAALYKASQRGRLRTVRRAGALMTSAAWIAEYADTRPGRGGS